MAENGDGRSETSRDARGKGGADGQSIRQVVQPVAGQDEPGQRGHTRRSGVDVAVRVRVAVVWRVVLRDEHCQRVDGLVFDNSSAGHCLRVRIDQRRRFGLVRFAEFDRQWVADVIVVAIERRGVDSGVTAVANLVRGAIDKRLADDQTLPFFAASFATIVGALFLCHGVCASHFVVLVEEDRRPCITAHHHLLLNQVDKLVGVSIILSINRMDGSVVSFDIKALTMRWDVACGFSKFS